MIIISRTTIRANDFLGSISQWQENKKKQPKAKDAQPSSSETATAVRGGRGRGAFEGRGRGRGTERGRGGRGGRAGAHTNGAQATEKAATPVGDGWDTQAPPASIAAGSSSWETPVNGDATTAGDWATDASNQVASTTVAVDPKGEAIPTGKVSGWNKLFEKPRAIPATKQAPATTTVPQDQSEPAVEETIADERLPAPPTDPVIAADAEEPADAAPEVPASDPPIVLTPSKDELTETNLEQLPDLSNPPATQTAASTTASTQDPRNLSMQNTVPVRPGMGISGYAANAARATSGANRSASFVRKVMEQQEAVVMPGNHAVDRAAVQFGSMGLNGSSDDLDVDEDREEPETRTQLPDDSPAAPRASLPPPPAQAQAQAQAQAPAEISSMPRPAPGLPPAPQQQSTSPPQTAAYADQFARYGQSGQKAAYDPFGQQQMQQSQPQAQAQEPFSNQTPSQPQQTPSSAPNDYSSYYSAGQQRDAAAAYQNFYAGYGQSQEAQQRSGSAFGTSAQDAQTQYATSRPQAAYAQQDAQNSGNNTPNPTVPGQQTQPSQQMHQGQGSYGGYPYGYPNAGYGQQYPQYGQSYMNQMNNQQHRYGQHRPMFDDVRRQGDDHYMAQNSQYGYGQQYAGAQYNKSSMYGQPQHQYSYEHSASPANAGSFPQTSMAGRESMYGRAGSTQPVEAQQAASTPFGMSNDPFARTQSGFGTQAQPMSQQHSGQQGSGIDPSKEYDAAKVGGPSPSISQVHRPGSTTNMPGQHQSGQAGGFPTSQAQQTGQNAFGSYPQYGGLGSFGGHQGGQNTHQQQTAGYGSYGGAAGFGGGYAGNYGSGRGGWNGNGNYSGGH